MVVRYSRQRARGYCFCVQENGCLRIEWASARSDGVDEFVKYDRQHSLEGSWGI